MCDMFAFRIASIQSLKKKKNTVIQHKFRIAANFECSSFVPYERSGVVFMMMSL